jgi:hypothetical protein
VEEFGTTEQIVRVIHFVLIYLLSKGEGERQNRIKLLFEYADMIRIWLFAITV